MGKIGGFKDYRRRTPAEQPPAQRIKNYNEFLLQLPEQELRRQGARCMECGVPFCHAGCPLGNIIPEFNDLVCRGDWRQAYGRLSLTNRFPEVTGRVCPAPCEEACVLGINEPPVTIKNIERAIADRAFEENWFAAEPPRVRTGKRVAVVGSGPAGLACADRLNQAGHLVTVFERADRVGGLLRYGIPDFKLEKQILDRRLYVMAEEGVEFVAGSEAGLDIGVRELGTEYDAVVLCLGATKARDVEIPGRDLDGVFFAMEYLSQQNRRVAGQGMSGLNGDWWFGERRDILADGKRVIVIGGGDTGSDCVGTAIRQGAVSVTQFELLPKPPLERPAAQPWPYWPQRLRTSSSHNEGCERYWSILSKEFVGDNGRLTSVVTVSVEWSRADTGRFEMKEIPGTRKEWPCDLVLLAVGFLGPETKGIVEQYGLDLDARGNIKTDDRYMTSVSGVFSCGDARRGQSLVVWAISEGREAACAVDEFLMGETALRRKGCGDLPASPL